MFGLSKSLAMFLILAAANAIGLTTVLILDLFDLWDQASTATLVLVPVFFLFVVLGVRQVLKEATERAPVIIAEYDSSEMGYSHHITLIEASHKASAVMVQIQPINYEGAIAAFEVVPHIQWGQKCYIEPRVTRGANDCGSKLDKLLWASIPDFNPTETHKLAHALSSKPGPGPIDMVVRYQDVAHKPYERRFCFRFYHDEKKWLLVSKDSGD